MNAELPGVTVIRGPTPGPTVAVLGGVHGDEYEGVIAAAAIGRMLHTELVCGTVRVAAPAHPAAWAARARRGPIDGADLARVFPGRADGSATEQVAYAITEHLIRGSDLLVDLHSAGSGFEMPFLCGYHGDGDHGIESQRYADAFAARYTWRHDGVPAPGRSLTAAVELGIPAIYVEGHGGLSIRADELTGYIDGVLRVLHLLGMLADAPPKSHEPVRVSGAGNTDAGILAPAAGYVVVSHGVGDVVRRGDVLARIVDVDGTHLADVIAPNSGVVMLLRRDALVSAGDTLFIVASTDDER
jgi:predicted deacylase